MAAVDYARKSGRLWFSGKNHCGHVLSTFRGSRRPPTRLSKPNHTANQKMTTRNRNAIFQGEGIMFHSSQEETSSNKANGINQNVWSAQTAKKKDEKVKIQKHTTAGIRWWSPTQLLICRSEACVWQSGRDAQFSSVYGRMWQKSDYIHV